MLQNLLNGSINTVETFIISLFSLLFVIFCTMPIHEAAHAFTAYKLGDNMAKRSGRLTLNPIAHINYMGALLILLFGFGWAEPVPVNQWNLKKPKRDMALIAAAGPISNILMAIVLMLLANTFSFAAISIFGYLNPVYENDTAIYLTSSPTVYRVVMYVYLFLHRAAMINAGLAAFNLIPLPPLDGSRILGAFLPNSIYYKLQTIERYSFIIVLALIATGVLSPVISFLGEYLFRTITFIAALPFKLFGAPI